MRLLEVRIEGYRCLDNVTLSFDELTVLLGSNSAGKSSVLRALQFFFEGEALTRDDVFDGQEGRQISVQVTFGDLTKADRDAYGVYASGAQMVLRRVWDEGGSKLTGRGLRYERFDEIRKLAGAQRRSAFQEFAKDNPELNLPDVKKVDEANDAMLSWEMAHPDQCVMSNDENATQFFGFRSVGQTRLAERFKFVFVPGLQDAAEEATERKGTILERLLTAIADQRAEADVRLTELEDRLRAEYSELVETTHRLTLDGLASQLGDQMRRYVPTAEIRLEPVAQQLRIAAPMVRMQGGEEQHLTDLGRQGHGFQRTFIIAALEYLATVQAEADGDRPTLFLAIEEPELYQHPPRAMHFAATLRELASSEKSRVQVCYATHSPYFVDPSRFSSVRICRRTSEDGGERAAHTTVTVAKEETVAEFLPERQRRGIRQRLTRTLRSSFREAFFARSVLLVEGDTDIAVFSQVARMSGPELASRGVVCAAVTKSVLPIAYGILTSLRIPTYVVFDGDRRDDGPEPCGACGRGGRDSDHDARLNQQVFAALGTIGADFPSDQFSPTWACFEYNLEHYLAANVAKFAEMSPKVATELGWRQKSAEVHAETLERLGKTALPEMLTGITKHVLAMAQ